MKSTHHNTCIRCGGEYFYEVRRGMLCPKCRPIVYKERGFEYRLKNKPQCPRCGSPFSNGGKTGICWKCWKATKMVTGPAHPLWKGGISVKNGYVRCRLNTKDEFHPMADKNNGMVLAHRLIMARHLGRCLKSTEIVHHLNGIRTDNRLENLIIVSAKEHGNRTFIHRMQIRIRELEQMRMAL